MATNTYFTRGYIEVNGLNMYYEVHGTGKPLVLIHGGGSTIDTTFGNLIPLLAQSRQLIAVELQAHGHTADRGIPLSFRQDADDIAALLANLQILKADFLGFSNGGQTLIEIALRHKGVVDKIIIASAFYKLSAVVPQFWEGFNNATIDAMPNVLQEGYLKANNSREGLMTMFRRDVERMKHFKGWTDEQMASITAPALIINGNNDVGSAEHALEMQRTMPDAQLAVLPGGHGSYIGTIESLPDGKWTQQYTVGLINDFLDAPTTSGRVTADK